MPSKKTSKTDEVTKEPVPVKETKTTKKTATKEVTPPPEKVTATKSKSTTVPAQPVAVSEPVAAAEVDNVVVSSDCDSLTESFTGFMTRFQAVMTQFNALKTEFKNLEKRTTKQLKAAENLDTYQTFLEEEFI